MSFSLNLELTEKRAKEIANLETDQARTHALKTHEWEDKIYDAISTVWDAAISLDAHGFICDISDDDEKYDYPSDKCINGIIERDKFGNPTKTIFDKEKV